MSEEQERAALGTRLRDARTYRGYSQEDVASYLKISRPSVSLIESGARGVDTLELQKLADLFDCGVDELLGTAARPPEDEKGIAMVARAAAQLSPEDQSEVLRFAQFLQSRKRRRGDGRT